jgi:hypothetical protein
MNNSFPDFKSLINKLDYLNNKKIDNIFYNIFNIFKHNRENLNITNENYNTLNLSDIKKNYIKKKLLECETNYKNNIENINYWKNPNSQSFFHNRTLHILYTYKQLDLNNKINELNYCDSLYKFCVKSINE